jgi:hypothetical protein
MIWIITRQGMVPEVGLEPTRRTDPRGILSPLSKTDPLGKSMIY